MIDESTAQRVLGDFGFTEPVEWVRPLSLGTKGASVRVRVDGRDWVLKSLLPTQVPRAGLARTVEMALADAGFPVAAIRRSCAGRALVEHEGMYYSLHGWVEGHHVTIAERDSIIEQHSRFLRDVGSALGQLHQIASRVDLIGVDAPVTTGEMLLRSPQRAVRRIRRPSSRPPLLSMWHRLRLKPGKSSFDQWVIEAFPDVASHAVLLRKQLAANPIDASDIVIIHNDINWENLLFDEGFDLRAILDFDNVTRAPRVAEVGAAAVVLAGARLARVEQFVSAYEEATDTQIDTAALELAMSLKCVQSILNSMTTHLRPAASETVMLESWCRHLYVSMQELRTRWPT